MYYHRTKRCVVHIALVLALALLSPAGNAGASQAWQPNMPMQQGQQTMPMQPGQPNMPMQPGPPSPIDGFWSSMTPQGPVMMGLQNGMFAMMGPNMQVYGQGTFTIQGQQIISTLANGQQEIFDFQTDGMNLQLRDTRNGAIINYQKMPNMPTPPGGGYPPPGGYPLPGGGYTPPGGGYTPPGGGYTPPGGYPGNQSGFPQMQEVPQLPR